MNKFDIPSEEVLRIFQEMILPQMTDGVVPQITKEAFILGGQSGSGKSAFAREILKTETNIVFINGDDLRAYHPKYYFYLQQNDVEAADLTQAVCNFWIEELIKGCVRLNLNLMVEGTMRKTSVPMATAQFLHDHGYFVNLVAISTPYELSMLSLELRYKEIKRLGGVARYTKKSSHDEAYNNAEAALLELSCSDLFGRYYIYSRTVDGFERDIFEPDKRDEMIQVFNKGRQRDVDEKEREISNMTAKESNFTIK